MKWKLSLVVPPLLASWSHVLTVYSSLPAGTPVVGWGAVLAFSSLVAFIAIMVGRLAGKDAEGGTIVSVAFVGLWIGSGYYLRMNGGGYRPLLVAGLLLLAIIVAVRLSSRWRTSAAAVLSSAAVFLAIIVSANVLLARTHASAIEPILPPTEPGGAAVDRPDIYLLVLDKYTGSRSLRENYGFDNSSFEADLLARGFTIPQDARSNYPHTRFALPSMLNWVHIDQLVGDTPSGRWTERFDQLIEENRTWKFLKALGYEFIVLPSTFPATRSNRFADLQIGGSRPSVDLGPRWLVTTPLLPVVVSSWAREGFAFPYPVEDGQAVKERLRETAALAGRPGPFFAFVHLLVPHEPYVFDASCNEREPWWPETDYSDEAPTIRKAYVDQVRCVNTLVLETVDSILARSSSPPVILLQADHGHGMMAVNPMFGEQLPFESLGPEQVEERTDIFAAYHLPGGGGAAIYDSITPVNLFPSIFNFYFDAQIPLQEDRIYWSHLHPPHRVRRLR